jgi:FkbM family methyltransferase
MSIKRHVASFVERAFNVRFVRPHVVTRLFEEFHLKKVLHRFDVDCVFDIGANTGQYAEMLREKAGYRGEILSYEPNPNVVATLRERAKGDLNWHINEVALGCAAGRRPFNIMANDQFSSFLSPSETDTKLCTQLNRIERRIDVETHTLAQEFANWSQQIRFRHPFLKMDTQGNDVAVIQGGESVLRNFIGIQTELAIKRLYDGAPEFVDALEYIRSMGFELSALVPNNEGHFPQLIEIDAILIRKDLMV